MNGIPEGSKQQAAQKQCPACGSTRLMCRKQFGMLRFRCRSCGFEHF